MAINRQRFLSQWFGDCEGEIELRVLPGGKQEFFSLDDYRGIDAFVSRNYSHNIYLGIATRNGRGGTKSNVLDIPGVWADIDFKIIMQEKADELIANCPLRSTFIIDSGGGYHAYWQFKEPTGNIEIVEHINQQLMQYFGSDAIYNVDRSLRLPDTQNYKYNPSRPVEILACNQSNRYDQIDFEEHFPALKQAVEGKLMNPPGWQDVIINGVKDGQRNKTAAQLAGRYFAKGLSKEEILVALRGWNLGNKPHLDDVELRKVIDSVDKTDKRNHPPQEDPLQFPNIYSGAAKKFADAYSARLEAPYHYFYIGYLTMLGLIVTGRITLDIDLKPQPRLFPFFIGNTATTKKSTAIDRCVEHFLQTVPNRFETCWGLGSPEGLQEKAKKLENPKRILLAYDEFKTFVSKAEIPQSVLLPCVSTLFEKNVYENITKHTPLRLVDVHLVMMAASTLDTYQRIWDSSFSDIGLDNRFFIVPGQAMRKYALPKPVPLGEGEKLKQNLYEILQHAADYPLLRFATEAERIYNEWYHSRDLSIHSNRLETYALRFMILFAVNDKKKEIDVDIVNKATRLMDWQLEVRREYDPSDAESRTAKMQEAIRKVIKSKGEQTGKGLVMGDRRLRQYTHANRVGLGIYLVALKQMREVGEIDSHNKGYHELLFSGMAST